MASATGIKAGQAFVELYADDSKLTANLAQAETQVKAFGKKGEDVGNLTGQTFGEMGRKLKGVTWGLQAIGPELDAVAGQTKLLGGALKFIPALLSGPAGWAALGVAAVAAGVGLLFTKDSAAEAAAELEKTEKAAKRTAEQLGELATVGPGGNVSKWDTASNAVSKHTKTQEALAKAMNEVTAKQEAMNAAKKRFAALTQSQREAAVEDEGLQEATTEYQDALAKLREAKDDEKRAKAKADRLTAEQAAEQQAAADSAFALSELSASAAAGAVQGAVRAGPQFAAPPGTPDIFSGEKEERARQDKQRAEAFGQAREIAAFRNRQDRDTARMEIELSGKTKKEKARSLLELQHQFENEDLWAAGFGGTDAEEALAQRQAMQTKLLDAQQKSDRQSTAGTFNATMVGRMGTGNYAERTARATEKVAKNTEELLKKPAAALAFG